MGGGVIVSSTWVVPICAWISLYTPFVYCLHKAVDFTTSHQRWLLFFVCFFSFVIPLHMITVFGFSLPFVWETTLFATLFLAYDDAKGAQIVFCKYAVPFLRPVYDWVNRVEVASADEFLDDLRRGGKDTGREVDSVEMDPKAEEGSSADGGVVKHICE